MARKANTNTGTQVPTPAGAAADGEIIDTVMPALPLIAGECAADQHAFELACRRALRPKDAIEDVWAQDFIDYEWELQRLRRMKVAVIQAARREAMREFLPDYLTPGDLRGSSKGETARLLAEDWSRGNPKATARVINVLKRHDLSLDAVMAAALLARLDQLECFDKLIGVAEHRRNAALGELEKRRDLLAKRAREFATGQATDVDVEILPAAQ